MMQLAPVVRQALDPRFLAWYLREFRSSRHGYVHWSAGHRVTNFADYHVCITVDGGGTTVVRHNTPVTDDLHAHTYQRNTDSFAVCAASMYAATSQDFGPEPPTPAQIRAMASELAGACVALRVPVGNLMTHAEAADNLDGARNLEYYGPANGCERWDWWVLIDPLTLRIEPMRSPVPHGRMAFGDWLRGEVILEIAKATEGHWKH